MQVGEGKVGLHEGVHGVEGLRLLTRSENHAGHFGICGDVDQRRCHHEMTRDMPRGIPKLSSSATESIWLNYADFIE